MTPIEPGEEVDEADVINVEGPDGIVRRYHRRKMGIDHMKNGKLSNNFIQGAFRVVDGLKALGWVLGVIGMFLWGLTEWVIVPQLEKKIDAAAKAVARPLDDRLAIQEQVFAAHVLAMAERARDYPTKEDLQREVDEIRTEIREIRR